jgi:hypothetical protein
MLNRETWVALAVVAIVYSAAHLAMFFSLPEGHLDRIASAEEMSEP